jgi:hypothetical protein
VGALWQTGAGELRVSSRKPRAVRAGEIESREQFTFRPVWAPS